MTDKINQVTLQLQTDIDQQTPDLRTKYLGKKGVFNQLAKSLQDLPAVQRKSAGQQLNQLKDQLETAIARAERAQKAHHTWVDLTIPGQQPAVGHMHPISQAMEEITRIFDQIGFTRVRYPEVDWDWYVFEALNMAPDHPARDEWETFFLDMADTTQDVSYDASDPQKRHPDKVGGKVVMTTHTSNGQVREMERLNSQPPIRMINMGRCYRRQQDATHTQMFHQFEGLVVDQGITIQHLKGTLDYFAEQFFGPGTKSRIRPFHFQFTEPSFEVDFSCHICQGTGQVSKQELEATDPRREEAGEYVKCKFCKSGWHEVGGAGMVHPNVLKAGGIDPTKYTGFAFGWGVERTYTLKQGLNIDDIRLLYSGDLQFLEQF
jgi:phenylalanyl-tRNA synthetase alpha chain